VYPVPPPLQLSGAPGPAEQQARYFQLMKQGWSNNDACRAVGICRKTGTRWRLGRIETKNGHVHSYPAVEPVNTTISARFLSEQERVRSRIYIGSGKACGLSPGNWVGPCRRSAENCGVTATRPIEGTCRTLLTGSLRPAGSGPKRQGSPPTRCSGNSSTASWANATARNRLVTS
jgi:hypothetical protein